jgi:tRNA nucleotidyltransferase (CCA-adding enzyme)
MVEAAGAPPADSPPRPAGAATSAATSVTAAETRENVAMEDLRDRLRELPCGRRLLDAAAGVTGVHLVGGAVRDLLLGRPPRELDVVVEGDVGALAARLADGAGAGDAVLTLAHERFGTATVRAGDCRWDLAAARAESYAHPGALPDVRPAGIAEDLRRRDVTVNALALDLASGTLRTAPHAEADLAAGRLRVLHDASFLDDPTRLWRLARYAARLGFEVEAHTAQLAREAVAAGAPETVSGARIGNELRLALAEPDPLAALEAAAALGLAPWLAPDRALAERALALLPAGDGRRDLLVLAASLAAPGDEADARLADLRFGAADRAIVRACRQAPALDDAPRSGAELGRALRGLPVEAVALAGARGGGEAAARRWLDELRHVGLQISGDDLRAAGIAEGADLGRRLQAVLDLRLDGAVAADRDAQLAAALAVPVA